MKRSVLLFAAIATLLLVLSAPAHASAAPLQPRTVATLPFGADGSFAESMTAVAGGNLYTSLTLWGDSNTGQIWKVTPSGTTSLVASIDLGPNGAFMGIAHDAFGRLYVADADFSGTEDSLIYKVGPGGSMTVVADLPPGSWPNGLACYGGYLFAADSSLGAIWRVPLRGNAVKPTSPWFQSALLAPGDPSIDPSAHGIGANGIAFQGGSAYVTVSDSGRVVRIPVSSRGNAGRPHVVCQRSELRTADGVAFDKLGNLWVVTNEGPSPEQASGALFAVSPAGSVHQIPVNPSWFDYPTQLAFGTSAATRTTLFITNGAFSAEAAPNVIALKVRVAGQLLP
jgi:sugar lactone lactonase YvrE